ncbi:MULTISPECIES: serine/threonine-protein kinase [unclassified Curtobacterium]|uniref:serine/threonine-protein kinase n=1 Tax=unclassified Curtobacterium TaxID=257496 RepID=UPI0010CE9720|nr:MULTISPECIES: serine/threonine-protein kinase [unclassified Curtobacterium]TCL72516.1 protein kinase-like protein [Curtobacterium sp. PhB128]TCL90589.1 protein kinase-like protein [Curtobacterium sp. PhB138]TDW73549.1 protein kinase-like protein [Curtobacterium sp. PhB25]
MSRYTRATRIDGGGQGEVWLGRDEVGNPVAIKYLNLVGNDSQQAEERRRFQREVTCQASLDHPQVLPILGSELGGAQPHFAMPLAEGSLRGRLAPGAGIGIPEPEALRMFQLILEGVEHAHLAGVIHRDLKPENILILEGRPVLSDFGLGRRLYSDSTTLTMTNVGMGTFAYSAPEQFNNAKEADQRSDVFALGRIFYEMLSGQMSITGQDLERVPGQYRFIINKATQIDPERRFATVGEMLREVALLGREPGSLLSPAEQAISLVEAIASGDIELVDEFARLVLEKSDDLQLFIQVVPKVPESVLAQLATRDAELFHQVMLAFDGFADGSFGFDFTDNIAVFLLAAYRASADMRVHGLVINRLLVLGASHNRWFVRDRFIDAVRLALRDAAHAPVVAAVLRDNAWALDFVREPLRQLSLPRVVEEVLAA